MDLLRATPGVGPVAAGRQSLGDRGACRQHAAGARHRPGAHHLRPAPAAGRSIWRGCGWRTSRSIARPTARTPPPATRCGPARRIAYRGDTFASRVSGSLVTAIGLPELIAETPEEYRDLAVRLSTDRAALAQVKAKLAANRLTTPLFDSRQFVRHLEAAYEAIWRRCLAGLAPDHIDIRRGG